MNVRGRPDVIRSTRKNPENTGCIGVDVHCSSRYNLVTRLLYLMVDNENCDDAVRPRTVSSARNIFAKIFFSAADRQEANIDLSKYVS